MLHKRCGLSTLVVIALVLVVRSAFAWRAAAYADFPTYRQQLTQKGLAVVEIQNDAYPAMFKVQSSTGADLVTSRSADALVFKVPDDGKVVLKTASAAWLWGIEEYVPFPTQLRAGDFIGPRGGRMGGNQARDLYVDVLHERPAVTRFFQDVFSWILQPTPSEDW